MNACEIAGKALKDVKVVFNGAGAAGISCAKMFVAAGVQKNISAILFVVHVERTLVGKDDDSVVLRIVSARRADRKERELYDEG